MKHQLTEEERIIRDNICAGCGARLAVYWDSNTKTRFIACRNDQAHRTLARAARGEFVPNIEKWRSDMVAKHGEQKAQALAKYAGNTALVMTEQVAHEMLATLWPEAEKASPVEFYKALTICRQYQLNPLMGHVFLIPFEKKDKQGNVIGVTHTAVLSIKTNRLIASRRHHWAFLDMTPRSMTQEEEVKVFGSVNPDRVRKMARIRDVDTRSEAYGFGEWPKWREYWDKQQGVMRRVPNEPKGTDKGNSMDNMACNRAERQALARLYPEEMPAGDIPVIDERYEAPPGGDQVIEGDVTEVMEPGDSPFPEPAGAMSTETDAGSAPASSADATGDAPVVSRPAAKPVLTRSDLMAMTFANAGEILTACVKHLKIQRSQLAIDVPEYDLNDPKQRVRAWQTLISIHWQGE